MAHITTTTTVSCTSCTQTVPSNETITYLSFDEQNRLTGQSTQVCTDCDTALLEAAVKAA